VLKEQIKPWFEYSSSCKAIVAVRCNRAACGRQSAGHLNYVS